MNKPEKRMFKTAKLRVERGLTEIHKLNHEIGILEEKLKTLEKLKKKRALLMEKVEVDMSFMKMVFQKQG